METLKQIILTGMKSSGKTTTGRILAKKLGVPFTDMDAVIENHHQEQKNESLRFREIFSQYGKEYFRSLETAALEAVASSMKEERYVLATGGGLPLAEENQKVLERMGTVVFLDTCPEVLLSRIIAGGVPAFFPYPEDPERSLTEILAARRPVYLKLADITVECLGESPSAIAGKIIDKLERQDRED